MKSAVLRTLCLLCAVLLGLALVGCGEETTPAEDAAVNGAPTTVVEPAHDHKTPASMPCNITTAENGTHGFVIQNHAGKELYALSGLKYAPVKETVNDTSYSVSWATGTDPNDYKSLYCDRLHCRISQPIPGVLGTDGVRVAYPLKKEDGCYVVVRDIYDEQVYSKSYKLMDAYLGEEYTVVGGEMVGDTRLSVSYLVSALGEVRTTEFDLYENKSEQLKNPTKPTKAEKE